MNSPNQTFWQHLEELRKTLVQIGLTVAICILLALFFYSSIIGFLLKPLENNTPISHQSLHIERITNTSSHKIAYRLPEEALIVEPELNTLKKLDEDIYEMLPGSTFIIRTPVKHNVSLLSPIEGIISSFKVSFWVGLIISSPIWIYQLILFILPALHQKEKKRLIPFILISYLCIGAGVAFAYTVTLPIANQYLLKFNESIGQNIWSISYYLDFTLLLLIAHGLAFEILAILFILIHFKFVSPASLIKARRYVIVLIFILSAILTPPDVITQLLMAFPLIILYELAIFYSKLRNPRKILAKIA